jgi:hypothetical protein
MWLACGTRLSESVETAIFDTDPSHSSDSDGVDTDAPQDTDPPDDSDVTDDTESGDTDAPLDIPTLAWTAGPFTAVDASTLWPLPGVLGGPEKWVSNNPESFTGDGWLMQLARDSARGGAAHPVTAATAYLFHVNHAGSKRTLHLIATNPGASTSTVTARGLLTSNASFPLSNAGTGPSYQVALASLTGDLTPATHSVAPGRGVEIASISLADGAMADGRFQISATTGVYLYTVVTTSGRVDDAINASQGDPAAGVIASPDASRYGREAGVYAGSEWVGAATVAVPDGAAHLGLCFDTDAKFAREGVFLQDQTAAATLRLDDSAERTWGAYGHRYDVTLKLHNPSARPRTATVRLASLVRSDASSPSFTWNAPFLVDDEVVTAWTTPRAPTTTLAQRELPAGGERTIRVQAVVPGLITTGAALILEVDD